MLESRPSRTPGIRFGYLIIVGLIVLDIGLLVLLFNEPLTLFSFLWGCLLLASIPAVAFVAFWTSALGNTRYYVEGDLLIIRWGGLQYLLQLSQIEGLVAVPVLQRVRRFRGLRWPGYLVGEGEVVVAQVQADTAVSYEAVFFATRSHDSLLLLVSQPISFVVSPVDLENFRDCIVALQATEIAQTEMMSVTTRLNFLHWPLWRDKLALGLMGAAVGLNGLLFALLAGLYGRFPAEVPLHFNRLGMVDRIGSPANLFILPIIGFLAWLTNLFFGGIFYHGRGERMTGYVAWGTAVLVQLATWVALGHLLAAGTP